MMKFSAERGRGAGRREKEVLSLRTSGESLFNSVCCLALAALVKDETRKKI